MAELAARLEERRRNIDDHSVLLGRERRERGRRRKGPSGRERRKHIYGLSEACLSCDRCLSLAVSAGKKKREEEEEREKVPNQERTLFTPLPQPTNHKLFPIFFLPLHFLLRKK